MGCSAEDTAPGDEALHPPKTTAGPSPDRRSQVVPPLCSPSPQSSCSSLGHSCPEDQVGRGVLLSSHSHGQTLRLLHESQAQKKNDPSACKGPRREGAEGRGGACFQIGF